MDSSIEHATGGEQEEWITGHDGRLPAGPHCHEVNVAEWPTFCRWFTTTFGGIELIAESSEGISITTEAINLPLEFIETRVLENGVGAITIAVRAGSRLRRLNITAAQHIRMFCNAAGWPTELEIMTSGANVSLRFSNGIESPAEQTICWGE